MATRRVIANPFENQIPTVSATAKPVEIYQRPVVKDKPWQSLIDTLTTFEQKAVPAFKRIEAKRAEAEFSQGLQLYNKTRLNIGKAVKDGVIDEADSPYLLKGYRAGNLNVLAARYATDLDQDLVAKKLWQDGDPDKIKEYVANYYDNFIKDNNIDKDYVDTEIAEYFSTNAIKANEAFRAKWIDENRKYMGDQFYVQKGNEISAYTATLYENADTDDELELAGGQLQIWLEARVKEWEADGLRKDKLNQLLVDSVVQTALETQNTDVLDVLKKVKLGTGNLGSTSEARTKVYDAEIAIAKTEAAIETKLRKAEEAQRDVLRNNASANATTAIIKYFDGSQSPDDAKSFWEQMGVLNNLAPNDEKAAKLYTSMYKFWSSEEAKLEEDLEKQLEAKPRDMLEGMILMENVKTTQELFDRLAELSLDESINFSKAEIKQLLDYGKTKLRTEGGRKSDLQDSTSAASMRLKDLLALIPAPVLDPVAMPSQAEIDANEVIYQLEIQRLKREFSIQYFNWRQEYLVSHDGREPSAEEKWSHTDLISRRMSSMLATRDQRFKAMLKTGERGDLSTRNIELNIDRERTNQEKVNAR